MPAAQLSAWAELKIKGVAIESRVQERQAVSQGNVSSVFSLGLSSYRLTKL
jgi:hypothetical protein